jgi:phosphoenolpyruvate-protein kinase (PTS system EI component)
VCVQLLDAGADKPLPFIGFLAEPNPALGRQGVRLLNRHHRLMGTQLRAILKLTDDYDVSILIPMTVPPWGCTSRMPALSSSDCCRSPI